MSKEARTIAARGLTVSNIGSKIRINGETFIIEGITYQGDTTFVKVTNYLSIPNLQNVEIWDA